MNKTVQAIAEDGVFRPVEPVDLPDRTAVEFEPRIRAEPPEGTRPSPPSMSAGLAKVYAILGERFDSGERDVTARHDEQPP